LFIAATAVSSVAATTLVLGGDDRLIELCIKHGRLILNARPVELGDKGS
jgi:hypothetical protein